MARARLLVVRLLLPALVLVGAGWLLLPSTAAPTTSYVTAPVERRDLEQSVLADGTLQAQKLVSVGAQVSGQIKALHVALGDEVKQGDLLVEIDDLTQQNALKDTEAALDNVQAQLASRRATLRNNLLAFERQRKVLARGLGSQADYDSAEATLTATRADIRALTAQAVQARIAVDTARVNLGYTRIVSPMAGTIVAIPVEQGQTVNAVQSTPTMVKVARLDTMTVEAQISEADVSRVKAGLPSYFTVLGAPELRYQAHLRAIEPAPDTINDDTTCSSSTSTAVYYHGLFEVENPEGVLRIGMTAQVHIVLATERNALVIPAIALSGDRVQVVDGAGLPQWRQVKVGLNNKVDAQILAGLAAGEAVVVSQLTAKSQQSGRMGPPMGM
ncbi:efflux RND transporter periplasmic adaptor subunit [Aeromonas hydrophila]|uniref:efflux RND transporter periplasmic adaptor subunit n=3 Tax=Aeromonas hydrophila TaxID=644 RepID=UPI0005D7FCB3|nr:efflux RND transporter periplasmic adaptor subunit [Aeromonas hydrophila]AKA18795.1 hemolysin secretion protein D [Aeromonas hydrophila]HAT2249017.1 efflux RND transporter periplasmic adaptor subunit [Aeromonas hydrophila]HAT2384188.1 efflux RND transporter periplasmic adaptor subunit [Aeromonas hydrophila]HAT2416476.1 efflux RND transporter periplasmic adaptor subunit [Aeromonas hydrophila]HAT2527337.1 efflux RND transporter periplasmic adaptor subunit [Aeromonas hydrophila]